MIWPTQCRISGFDIRAFECDTDASLRSSLHVKHASDFNYNRSFNSKRPADKDVCRSRGRHDEYCCMVWRVRPIGIETGTSWSQGILFSIPIVSPVPPRPFHFTAVWPSLAPLFTYVSCRKQWGKNLQVRHDRPSKLLSVFLSQKFHYSVSLRHFTTATSSSTSRSGN
jgi:hypothetical protein